MVALFICFIRQNRVEFSTDIVPNLFEFIYVYLAFMETWYARWTIFGRASVEIERFGCWEEEG